VQKRVKISDMSRMSNINTVKSFI